MYRHQSQGFLAVHAIDDTPTEVEAIPPNWTPNEEVVCNDFSSNHDIEYCSCQRLKSACPIGWAVRIKQSKANHSCEIGAPTDSELIIFLPPGIDDIRTRNRHRQGCSGLLSIVAINSHDPGESRACPRGSILKRNFSAR